MPRLPYIICLALLLALPAAAHSTSVTSTTAFRAGPAGDSFNRDRNSDRDRGRQSQDDKQAKRNRDNKEERRLWCGTSSECRMRFSMLGCLLGALAGFLKMRAAADGFVATTEKSVRFLRAVRQLFPWPTDRQ